MSRCTMIGYVLLLAGLAVSVGCPHTAPRIYPPSISASAAGAAAVEMFDLKF
jgi:hypothetical protein